MRKLFVEALFATVALAGCGGGGDGGDTAAPPPAPAPAPAPVTELEDTATLPTPPANSNPSLITHDAAAEAMLANGGYLYYKANIIALGGTSDCDFNSHVVCPAFDRVKIGPDGKFVTESWAYFPVQKKWASLRPNSSIVFQDISGDIHGDGSFWSTVAFSPSTTGAQIQNNRRVYSYGTVDYRLGVAASSLAGQTILAGVPAAGNFSPLAKRLTFGFEQTSGDYYVLRQGGNWSGSKSSDDKKSYAKLADLRAAHTSLSNPYCLDNALASSNHVVFDVQQPGASIYSSSGICSMLSALSDGTVVQEGVATVGGRKLIVLQNPFAAASDNSSVLQYVPIVGLSDTGVGARGKHYFVGYSKTYSDYVNEAALLEWMRAQYKDAEAVLLPR